jgi:acetylornithine deacetylase
MTVRSTDVDVDVIGLTRGLVDIDSTTGLEADAGRFLSSYLRDRGFSVVEQRVDSTRFNVFATVGQARPEIVFSTHFDCVPPFFPSSIRGDRIHGRGACDAKGILAAQVAAGDAMRQAGEKRIGLLFVVGEERGSDGARAANLASTGDCRFLINGEPTDNRLGVATRGMVRYRLSATGRAAHSSFPELGESAIDKLIDVLMELRSIDLPDDPVLGRTHYTIGTIAGGVAPNVVSPSAEAELMFRTVSDAEEVAAAIAGLRRKVGLEKILEVPPVRLTTLSGFDTAVFPYTTDVPFLKDWGSPLLFGPGSIHAAHTADEFIDISELREAVDAYIAIAGRLLEHPTTASS